MNNKTTLDLNSEICNRLEEILDNLKDFKKFFPKDQVSHASKVKMLMI